MANRDRDIPDHVDETVQAIVRLHAAHALTATRAERLLEAATSLVGRAAFAGIFAAVVATWIGANLVLGRAGFDPLPFPLLNTLLSFFAVCMTVMILIVQRRAQELGDHREQLMLELTLLSDRKTAKLIALVEELRRDDPLIRDRPDTQAEELTKTVAPEVVLEAIREVPKRPSEGDRQPDE